MDRFAYSLPLLGFALISLGCASGGGITDSGAGSMDAGDASPAADAAGEDGGTATDAAADAPGDDASSAGCGSDGECDDGLACNGAEVCDPSDPGADAVTGCVAGDPVDCDDADACTTDECVEPGGTCTNLGGDADMDGFVNEGCAGGDDCDDSRGDVFPGAAELCDGADNDCDGVPDDGFACAMGDSPIACRTSCGTSGTAACNATCSLDPCTAPEACNACDDDVDGSTDEGFACPSGSARACTSACGTLGTESCLASCDGYATCRATEVCNGCDDDADGPTDEGFGCSPPLSTRTCTTTCGSTGTETCSASCSWAGSCAAPTETCNGVDDDCDGSCDNGFACCAGASTACVVGSCPGTQTCTRSCAAGSCDLGPAPAGDTCASPVTIGGSGSFGFNTCAATNDYTATCGSSAGSPDIVYRLDITMPSTVVLEITAATFDTVLHLRESGCPGTQLLCDDDGGTGALSQISTTLMPGTYYVIVDGYSSTNSGTGTLMATITPMGVGNDECAGATSISLLSGRTTVTGSTRSATESSGSCGTAPDLWYQFTLSEAEVVLIDTFGSAYDTLLGMRDGSCAGANVGCTDDDCGTLQSQIVRTLSAGTYYVQVDGSSGTSAGSFTLNIEHLPLGNDPVARLLPAGSTLQTGSTSGSGAVTGSCGSGSAPEDMYYWTQCPSAAGGTFDGNTCHASTTYDTLIYLRSGVTGSDLSCNDDGTCTTALRSRVTATVPSGAGLFGFYVDGWSSSSGSYGALIIRP